MSVPLDANIQNACKALFGPDTCVSAAFLLSLKPNTIKTAFRKKAKETHPDLFSGHDPKVQRRQAEMFRVVNEAYDIMRRYCERRDRSRVHSRVHAFRRASDPPPPPPPPVRTAKTRTFRVDDHGWLYQGVVPQRRLEIARALATDPKLLALDEPAAGMNATEKLGLRALVVRWLGQRHVLDMRLDQEYLRSQPVNSEEGAPMGIGIINVLISRKEVR